MRCLAALVLIATCQSEPLSAAPDPVQPAVAIVAPPEPQQIRPVQVVLAPKQEPETANAEDLYQSAYMIRDRDPAQATKMFQRVVVLSVRGSATQQKALNQLAAMDALPPIVIYLRGYQLKDSAPEEASALFEQVIAATPEADELHQKAKNQLERLRAAP